ncbi:PurH2 [Desulforapulum autotrophicum HRM2]|uniref:PurH2 n=1 Tax=Desulforapulum autotrophicum (strain ATCC 43914 / DSM 3382 / VKM B-1955 / HRM2) TaxID=177437 RepID=C0QM64_DESAH|nr:PurH2 [Desulforapulum autotrophicum]ACN16381.1 PurH2 [Desulforapulum autotrophicum HRM2]
MGKNVVDKIDDLIPINTVLVSVSDKQGLELLIPALVAANPKVRILSTGGTFSRIQEILGQKAEGRLTQVADYTGQPETQGGLVKTLDFRIYLGLLTETYNDAHQADLKRTSSMAIDMVVANLYPFKQTIATAGVTCENARGNIDIGGPTMIRASAKNFIRVASVVDPESYGGIIERLGANNGCLSLGDRFELAKKAFKHTAEYDATISGYLDTLTMDAVKACYPKGA